MELPTLPNATTPGEVEPVWYTEPAKKIGAILSTIVAVLTVLIALVTSVTDLLPEKVRAEVVAAVGTVGLVVVGLQRLQAVLTRDRVWSPESIRATFGDPEYGGTNADYPAMPPVDETGAATTPPEA